MCPTRGVTTWYRMPSVSQGDGGSPGYRHCTCTRKFAGRGPMRTPDGLKNGADRVVRAHHVGTPWPRETEACDGGAVRAWPVVTATTTAAVTPATTTRHRANLAR